MVEASVTGLFRMILIIIGVFVILRFLGQVLIAKNNVVSQKEMKNREEAIKREKEKAKREYGNTKITMNKSSNTKDSSIEDVDYQDV